MQRKAVVFYFDPISPYSWLAANQIPEIEAHLPIQFDFVPVLFAGLLNAHGQKGPAEIAAKRRYTITDAMRWAAKLGIRFEGPPAHPFNPLKALRLCTAVEATTARRRLAEEILNACWRDGLDITDEDVLIGLASKVELAGQTLLNESNSEPIKKALRDRTDLAIEQGVFGVPTFWVDSQIFWGNDRLPFLIEHLQGRLRVDHERLNSVLNRPRAADRPQSK
ncbi:MAG: 2-hydroxychromene-2-carboxylate isomerase [Bdellovibrionales bacterium]|nr:2-hydroxychromene-2-carboxylate isomerase [Bdellovibrionales bacterium]